LFSLSYGETIHVPEDYSTIQAGINAASNGDMIMVAAGTYTGEGNKNLDFKGKAIIVSSINGPNVTIIDCENDGRGFYFSNRETSDSVVYGFTITNGSSPLGGGIYCYNASSPTITNNIIAGNSADGFGGGIYCRFYSSPMIKNCTIIGNSAHHAGGGLFCQQVSSPTVVNTIFWDNSPEEIIRWDGSSPAITYSDIQGGWEGEGNINTDPLFVNPDNGDYHLQADSPCIEAGNPSSPQDPDGTRVDIGALYYYHSRTIYVDNDNTGFEDGSQEHPFNTIQEGIDATLSGDTVLVADGTYTGEGNRYLDFKGKAITVTSVNGEKSTIIDCENVGYAFDFHSGEDKSSVVSGFTITNANHAQVASISCMNSSPAIISNMIIGNNGGYGAGISCNHSSPIIKENTIISNATPGGWGEGGGISCYNSSPTIIGNTIKGNESGFGGGVYCQISSPTIKDNVIEGNTANYDGGGIYLADNSSTVIIGNIIKGNAANTGGGVFAKNSSVIIKGNTISENTVISSSGGGIYCYNSILEIVENVITKNTVTRYGGGIYCANSSPSIKNNVIAQNTSTDYDGGGIYCHQSSPTIINCTITQNLSLSPGCGISCFSNSNPTIANVILWDNNDTAGIYHDASSVITFTYSDIQFGGEGIGNINADPMFVDAENGDYHLKIGSPCADAGNPTSDYSNESKPNGDRVNIGAYGNTTEATTSPPLPDIFVNLISLNLGQVAQSANQFLTISNEGDIDLKVTNISVDKSDFSVSETSFAITPNSTHKIIVTFMPQAEGQITGNLIIQSNDPDEGTLGIPVTGWGIPYVNRALSLDGINDYVSISNTANFDFTTTFTVSAWVKPDSQLHNYNFIIRKGGVDNAYALNLNNKISKFEWWVQRVDDGNYSKLISKTVYNHGTWYFLTGTYDGIDTKMYINGVEENSTNLPGTITTNNDTLKIGGIVTPNLELFKGTIDEVCVWNIALTQEQIQSTMYTSLIGNEDGLVGYWRFDEEPGTSTAYDSSPNANHGTLLGDADSVESDKPVTAIKILPLSQTVAPGNTTTINLKIGELAGFAGFEFKLRYKPNVIEITENDIQLGSFFAGVESVKTNDGKLKIKQDGEYNILFYGAAVYGNQAPLNGSGDLVTINLKGMEVGNTSLELSDIYVGDYQADRIYVDIRNGEIIVKETLGDVSGNGQVTAYDAALIFQHIKGIIQLKPGQVEQGDVDGNPGLTINDAKLILQKVVKSIPNFQSK